MQRPHEALGDQPDAFLQNTFCTSRYYCLQYILVLAINMSVIEIIIFLYRWCNKNSRHVKLISLISNLLSYLPWLYMNSEVNNFSWWDMTTTEFKEGSVISHSLKVPKTSSPMINCGRKAVVILWSTLEWVTHWCRLDYNLLKGESLIKDIYIWRYNHWFR